MLPFAWPTIKGPNFGTRSAVVVFLLPLVEGKGKGGNASAVIEEGLKSIKRHLWTDNVVVSPIDLISQIRECFGHFVRAHFLYLHVALTLTRLSALRSYPPLCRCLVEAPPRPRVPSTQNEWKWPYKSASLFLSQPVFPLTRLLRLDMFTDIFNRLVSQVF